MGRKAVIASSWLALSLLSSALPAAEGFASSALPRPSRCDQSRRSLAGRRLSSAPPAGRDQDREEDDGGRGFSPSSPSSPAAGRSRRDAIGIVAASSAALLLSNPSPSNADIEGVVTIPQSTAPPEATASKDGVTVFKTKSGLQYIDIEEGTGPSPKYGNLVSISYKAYVKLPDAQGKTFDLDEFDSDKGYLVKHGNGRTVPGLDEGLHTMKVGGKRRIIVPPKLGYVSGGLGPVPSGPYGRWKLNRLIDRMVEFKGGNLIYDVEMRSLIEDEADQGYYEDDSLSPEDFNTLRRNVENKQQEARAEKMS